TGAAAWGSAPERQRAELGDIRRQRQHRVLVARAGDGDDPESPLRQPPDHLIAPDRDPAVVEGIGPLGHEGHVDVGRPCHGAMAMLTDLFWGTLTQRDLTPP